VRRLRAATLRQLASDSLVLWREVRLASGSGKVIRARHVNGKGAP
jgi:hypothetical protein